jgi:hypothetical protein
MIDWFVFLAPVLLLAVLALLGFIGCDRVFGLNEVDPPIPTPTFDPPSGLYTTAQVITILYELPNATIYYSNDPSPQGAPTIPPTGPTMLYTQPIPIAVSTEFRAIAQAPNIDKSEVVTSTYIISPLSPIEFQAPVAETNEITNGLTVTTAPFNRNVTLGNLMVVWIWYKSTAQNVASVTDTANNIYQRAVGPTAGVGTIAGNQQEIWFAKGINGGANLAVTATFSSAPAAAFERSISAHEYSGASTTDPIDATSAAAMAGQANVSSGTAATTAARLIFGAAIFDGHGAAGPGFTQRSSLKNNVTEDGPITTLNSAEAKFSIVNGAQDWVAQMIALK